MLRLGRDVIYCILALRLHFRLALSKQHQFSSDCRLSLFIEFFRGKITLSEEGGILEQLYSTKQVSLCQYPLLGSMAKIEHAVWAIRQVRRELVSAIQNLLRTS